LKVTLPDCFVVSHSEKIDCAHAAHQVWGGPTAFVVGRPAMQSEAWSTWSKIVVETKEYSHGAWECLIDKYLSKTDLA
jgi:hypothetical protein